MSSYRWYCVVSTEMTSGFTVTTVLLSRLDHRNTFVCATWGCSKEPSGAEGNVILCSTSSLLMGSVPLTASEIILDCFSSSGPCSVCLISATMSTMGAFG